jgi:hypothetical protein
MRAKLATCLATAFITSLATNAIAAGEPCARTPEKAAFDVVGLKSELMVTAISCQAEERYNSFVARFRSDLNRHERALNIYFDRTAGRRASQQHDDYITSLANAQSQDGLKRGTLFCAEHIGLFDEVMALKDGKDLSGYASGKSLVQPIDLVECPAPPPKKAKTKTASK